jgi:hypothetical protein
MERAAVRGWAARRAIVQLGALLTTARAAAGYVNAAIKILRPSSAPPGPDER